jgi:hypothetical protein
MADLLRVQALLAAVGAELSGVEGSGLQYHRELVGGLRVQVNQSGAGKSESPVIDAKEIF